MFKVSTNKEALQDNGGSSYISKSGIYDVTIDFASVAVSSGGAESVNFNIDYNGNKQTIYGPYVTDKQGKPLEIGLKLINKLAVIAGLQEGDEPTIEQESHPVGKDNKEQDFSVITDFSGIEVKMRLQEEYAINPKTNEIRKSMVPKAFFRADGASADEIFNGTEVGVALAKEEKYASNITYRDNLTAEDVAAWKESKASGQPAAKPQPKTSAPKPGGLFGKK